MKISCTFVSEFNYTLKLEKMEALDKRERGTSDSTRGAILKLENTGSITTNKSLFKSVVDALRTSYQHLIEGKNINLNYKDCTISLS